jgi:cell division protein ZapE
MQPMPDYTLSVIEQLKSLTVSGSLQVDSAQMDVAKHLDHVLSILKQRRPAAKSSALGWLFASKKPPSATAKGLYIHGSVGRGKTMLMDMFFAMAPCKRKRRAHFHEFMADVHNRIAAHRLKLKNGETKQADPIPPVAADLYGEAELLRRVQRHRHCRCDDLVAAVFRAFRPRMHPCRDVERGAGQSLQGRP